MLPLSIPFKMVILETSRTGLVSPSLDLSPWPLLDANSSQENIAGSSFAVIVKAIFVGCAFFAASVAFLSASLLTLKLWLASSFVIYNLCQIFIVENYYYDIKREFKLQNHFLLVRITFDKFCTYMANCTFWCGTMLSWRSSRCSWQGCLG